MMYQFYTKNLNLRQIAESGQCFRWNKIDTYTYQIVAFDRVVLAQQEEDRITLSCDEDEFSKVWYSYFDLDTDYGAIIEKGRQYGDPFLDQAMDCGNGIRILGQDRWEIMVTFIISQNNNIPRITKSIGRLCGDGVCFPSPEQILELDLSGYGLGYRDEYLKSAAQWWLNGGEKIEEIKGVGIKVASCIQLFGFHDLAACPIDTWMKKIIQEEYDGIAPEWMSSGYAGVFQQYTFYYKRKQ